MPVNRILFVFFWMICLGQPVLAKTELPSEDEILKTTNVALKYLKESDFEYPVSFNGKMRFKLPLAATLSAKEVEEAVLASSEAAKYLEGNAPKKVIVVPGKIVNIVL